MKLSKSQRAILALIVANTIWGAAPPIFKWSLQDIGPLTLAFYRFLLATLITLPFVWGKLSIRPKDYLRMFFIGITGVTINIIFFFYGLQYAPSINASIVGSAGPLVLIFCSILFLKEKLRKKLLIGALIGLIGVLIIMFKPLLSDHGNFGSSFAILGNFFYFIGLLGSIVHTILSKRDIKRYKPITITFWTFLIGTLGFTPFFYQEGIKSGFVPHMTFPVVGGLVFGAVLSSFVGYYLFFWALKFLPAEEVGVFVYLDPIVTILLAIPLLGEIPDMLFLIGAFFVFFGIFIAEGRLHYHPIHKLFRRR